MKFILSRMYKLVFIVFLFLSGFRSFGMMTEDDTTQVLLLSDLDVQIASTQAINDMYNFKFDRAEQQFRWIRQRYPDHPIAYFLLALSDWWKINVNIRVTRYDDRFLAYIDTSLYYAEKLYKEPNTKIEGAFFLAAGYGFKGRLFSERSSYTKAAFAGRNSLKYFEDCKNKPHLSPELLFGDAIFNYFAVWIPENYPMLKPLMAFFPKGDKSLGLKQFETVSRNAFYTRTEAQYFLMRILASEENDIPGAMMISEYLHRTFPDNPYFHRYYTRLLYASGFWNDTERESRKILQRMDSSFLGYEEVSGRYASFYLGQINEQRRNLAEAKKYYHLCVGYAEATGDTDSGYYHYSLLSLGEIALKEGDNKAAKDYFKRVKKDAKRKDSVHKKARELLKES